MSLFLFLLLYLEIHFSIVLYSRHSKPLSLMDKSFLEILVALILHVAGVDVGHQFFSRAEMVAVGFHSHWLNGIDFMGSSYSKMVIHLLLLLEIGGNIRRKQNIDIPFSFVIL